MPIIAVPFAAWSAAARMPGIEPVQSGFGFSVIDKKAALAAMRKD